MCGWFWLRIVVVFFMVSLFWVRSVISWIWVVFFIVCSVVKVFFIESVFLLVICIIDVDIKIFLY